MAMSKDDGGLDAGKFKTEPMLPGHMTKAGIETSMCVDNVDRKNTPGTDYAKVVGTDRAGGPFDVSIRSVRAPVGDVVANARAEEECSFRLVCALCSIHPRIAHCAGTRRVGRSRGNVLDPAGNNQCHQ